MKATTVLGLFAIVLAFMWWMLSNNPNAGAGGTFCAEDETVFVQCRPIVNFAGVPVVATDNSAGNRIDVTLTAYTTVYDDGVAQSQQPFLNFISGSGQTITCANNATSTRTECTFTASGAAASGYATVQNNGSALTQRTIVNFINGSNATMNCVDNGGSSRTDCTVAASGAAGSGYATIQASGSALTARTVLNFQPGSAIIATDDAGNTRTNVTLDSDLIALAALASAGCLGRTGAASFTAVTLTAPAAGFTISNGNCSANPAFALANDLAALEALAGTGLAIRIATDTWSQYDTDCQVNSTALQYNTTSNAVSCDQVFPPPQSFLSLGTTRYLGVPSMVPRSTGTIQVVANSLYYFPMRAWTDLTIFETVMEVTTATGTLCRCGLYKANYEVGGSAGPTSLQPGTLVIDFGTFLPTTTGQKILAYANTTVPQGDYMLALGCDGTTTFRSVIGTWQGHPINPVMVTNNLLLEESRVSAQGAQITGGLFNPGSINTSVSHATTGFNFFMFLKWFTNFNAN